MKRHTSEKEYNYLSRYAAIPLYYDSTDMTVYYGTAKQLSRRLTSYRTHITTRGETYDTIALKYYNSPLYW